MLSPAGTSKHKRKWNAYRPSRVPSGDELQRASENLQTVSQACALHDRWCCRPLGVVGRVRGLTGLDVPAQAAYSAATPTSDAETRKRLRAPALPAPTEPR